MEPLPDSEGGLPRLALSAAEAAAALGVGVEFFERHVLPQLPALELAGRAVISVATLQRWLEGDLRACQEHSAALTRRVLRCARCGA